MKKRAFFFLLFALSMTIFGASAQVTGTRLNPTTVELRQLDGNVLTLDFYGQNIVRLFLDPQGGSFRDPEAMPPAQILVSQPRRDVGEMTMEQDETSCRIQTPQLLITADRATGAMTFTDRRRNKVVTSVQPASFDAKSTSLQLSAQADEYFYGGGVQNGRFSHKGKIIAIENTNNWTDGGVASPTPFYWSTAGYGILWHTFRPGKYDFSETEAGQVKLKHETPYLDLFLMVDDGCVPLLNDFYQLTGHPVLLPKFGFYEGHLNAYNRDYWSLSPDPSPVGEGSMTGSNGSVLFEDGKYYKESQKPVEGGIRESLNGELNDGGNYQFSARAVIDRYEKADMPLGWVLPNDGYGTGYGQTETLDGNVNNLRQFGEYARSKGVEIGLWTQSDLHPKEGVEALLQRDIIKEVRDAGVRVLKTDVAWVGAGYSFGLNGVADVGEIMPQYGNDARPFIISLDGWAGTQRYAGIWTGDQTGGEWEYIRFHLPTYIGSGLSGQPNICSDMDGIFGGRNLPVNIRDFQWKTFTPMQLNMDGWGSNPKYPQALGEPATSINRQYLKLKSELMPYTYTIAKEAVDGLPMIRPVEMIDERSKINDSQVQPSLISNPSSLISYEFLYGPSLLIAPIYQNTAADEQGNDIRNIIYLPEGEWVDWFTGACYEGNRVINNFAAPLWKLPVFVRRGAIIPMTNPHNNPSQQNRSSRAFLIYPSGHTEFTAYDDDGRTQAYLRGESATTHIISDLNEKRRVTVTVEPTQGTFVGMEKMQKTEFRIPTSTEAKKITLRANGKKLNHLLMTEQKDDYFILHVFTREPYDITTTKLELTLDGYTFDTSDRLLSRSGSLVQPTLLLDDWEEGCISPSAYTLPLKWTAVPNADYYEIEHLGRLYSTIAPTTQPRSSVSPTTQPRSSVTPTTQPRSSVTPTPQTPVGDGSSVSPSFTLEDLQPETNYEVRVRAVNKDGKGPWTLEKLRTSPDPLRFAIHGITAECSIPDQGGQRIKNLFDFDLGTTWHTTWDQPNSTPFDVTIDLHVVAQLDQLQYVPRPDGGNGTITRGTIAYSLDKQTWSEPVPFQWASDGTPKTLTLTKALTPSPVPSVATESQPTTSESQPTARYLRLHVEEARGGFGSGQQLYVFRVPGSEMMIPGDINHDGRIDENDFTSYMNYTGLRQGDGDFEGYISRGDINNNGLIDAYDISTVGIELESGVSSQRVPPVAGDITVTTDKQQVNAGEVVTLTISGSGLQSVNALSCAIPYDASLWEYVGIDAAGMQEMRNLTYDRLHTNGQKALYPTFVNCGEHPTLEGDQTLLTIRFRAKQKTRVNLQPQDGFLVDKYLNVINW